MEHILSNPGLIDIREQIFGHFDQKTLEICREVFANRFGEDWDSWLERLILVQRILEFGNKFKMKDEKQTFTDFVSGWDKAVKKFGKMASLKDLNEVNGSLLCLFVTNRTAKIGRNFPKGFQSKSQLNPPPKPLPKPLPAVGFFKNGF